MITILGEQQAPSPSGKGIETPESAVSPSGWILGRTPAPAAKLFPCISVGPIKFYVMTIDHAPVKGIVIAKIARTTAAVAKTILINTSTNRQHGGQAPVDVTCLESRDFEAAGSYSGLSRCLQTTHKPCWICKTGVDNDNNNIITSNNITTEKKKVYWGHW